MMENPYAYEMARWASGPEIVEPNLITGVGHGKCRPLYREKVEANHKRKKKTTRKMAKQSKRRNRK